jgi:hypothetical protein
MAMTMLVISMEIPKYPLLDFRIKNFIFLNHKLQFHQTSKCLFKIRTCILSGGSPYSYCGVHKHDVWCLVPENVESVMAIAKLEISNRIFNTSY